METTYNKLNTNTKELLDKLKSYLETSFYYYGSIQRIDFLENYSDVDIDIFTHNTDSTLNKLAHFFNLDKRDIKPVIYRTNVSDKIVKGFKVKYEYLKKNIQIELSIYNEKDKDIILTEHNNNSNIPFITCCMLLILKIAYYYLGIINIKYYIYLKKNIIHLFDKIRPDFIDIGFENPYYKEDNSQNK